MGPIGEVLFGLKLVTHWEAVGTIAAVIALSSCRTPQPVPDPPTPPPLASDVFDGIVADCSKAGTDASVESVRTCLGATNTAECLVAIVPQASADSVACSVRAQSMSLHAEVERTGGNDRMKAELAAADAWIRAKRIGYR